MSFDRGNGVKDYVTLLEVRRRRNRSFESKLAEAKLEHERCVAHQVKCQAALQQTVLEHEQYIEKLRDRLSSGCSVKIGEIQGARDHERELKGLTEEACEKVDMAKNNVVVAMHACSELRKQMVINDLRIKSLDDQVMLCRTQLARAIEHAEDEEVEHS